MAHFGLVPSLFFLLVFLQPFEHLDLYTVKSGEGIVSELFHFEDRGGRGLAIRPEFTPTPQKTQRDDLIQAIRDAGRVPVERDTLYGVVWSGAEEAVHA